ncbi:Gx transporter family protein [Paenibacillus sp. FSL R7-0297]|uniref:Gx transporter family protein n=1 Tax=unclassified Paenibacillus TaxID=185978 RepID=UPI0004F7C20E|nr:MULTISPECIES: Gx transporter family protein [unclassified Paenibacillus]AIQ39050.1 heptaprenyl diphosphate synthase [Paenibacillus sp. FSL R5-0912]KHL91602.1 heptaprenyl diphosphate synthase [Paenibacillus sp. IHB B 3415]
MPMSSSESATALKRTVIIAIFAAVAVVLSIVEAQIPLAGMGLMPGAKLGFANIMILTCIYFLRGRDVFVLVILKTLLTAFLLGTLSSLLFSLFGSLFSFVVMFALVKLGGKRFSVIGISIAGGLAHNTGQLLAASFVFNSTSIFYYLPILLITGIVTGIAVGFAVRYVVDSLSKISLFEEFLNGPGH